MIVLSYNGYELLPLADRINLVVKLRGTIWVSVPTPPLSAVCFFCVQLIANKNDFSDRRISNHFFHKSILVCTFT